VGVETVMRSVLLATALIGVASLFPGTDAAAQSEAWCSQGREDGGEVCRFGTYEQCVATSPDGWCFRNARAPAAAAPAAAATAAPATAAAPGDTPAAVETRPIRRPEPRQKATTQSPKTSRAATSIVPTRPATNISIPLPDRALLAAPPQFNCEFASANGASAPPQPTLASTQASPAGDAALRQKLDYEHQCYRHAAIISRDRLRNLQASIGETIKAVARSEQAGGNSGIPAGSGLRIPLPAQALLSAPTDFDCEFKAAATGSTPQPGPASADAALRTKLDYELQCYRHAELIWRTRVQQLQASVAETIKAVDRSKTAAERRGNRK